MWLEQTKIEGEYKILSLVNFRTSNSIYVLSQIFNNTKLDTQAIYQLKDKNTVQH